MDSPRSVCEMVNNFPCDDRPNVTNRYSVLVCVRSGAVTDSGSRNAVVASSNEMPCLRTFRFALRESHSNFISNYRPCAGYVLSLTDRCEYNSARVDCREWLRLGRRRILLGATQQRNVYHSILNRALLLVRACQVTITITSPVGKLSGSLTTTSVSQS